MNSEVKGKEVIDSIPVGNMIAGYFRVNEIPYGIKENLGKWSLLKSIMFHRDDVHVEKCENSIKVHLLGKDIDTIEVHYVSDMFRDFAYLMGYFTVSKVLESESVAMRIVNMQNRGVSIFNGLPDNAKGFFKISAIDKPVLEDIQSRLYSKTGELSCVLYNKDNDVIIHKNKDAVIIEYPMLDKKEEIHCGTILWNIFAQLFSVFGLVKDLGPDKETTQDMKHVIDEELYEAMLTIQNYCKEHCHDYCKVCALKTKNKCFLEAQLQLPRSWKINPPEYHVFG